MPENAAAEGGYGLGVSEAFGGQVGTGGLSGSAVGGAQGAFGSDFGGSQDDAPQAGRYGGPTTGRPNAEATNASVQALADRGRAIAAAAAAARGMAAKGQSQFGIGSLAPGSNVSAAQQAVSETVDALGTISPSAVAEIAEETGIPAGLVASMAQQAMSQQAANTAAATKGSGLGVGSIESQNPTVSTGTGQVAVDENGNIVSYGISAPTAPTAPGMTRGLSTTPSTTVSEDIMSLDQINVQDPTMSTLSNTVTNLSDTRPVARPEDDRSFFGRMADEFGMIVSTNPFASREDQAQSLIDKGYNPTDVSNFMARSINTERASNAAVENQIGAGDYLTESERLLAENPYRYPTYPYYG